jgi:hypothetical protein
MLQLKKHIKIRIVNDKMDHIMGDNIDKSILDKEKQIVDKNTKIKIEYYKYAYKNKDN